MINYTFTKEDVEFVEKAIELKRKGFYIDSMQLTEHYNRILHKNVNNTSCGTCLRTRVSELENALICFKAKLAQNEPKTEEPTNVPKKAKKQRGKE